MAKRYKSFSDIPDIYGDEYEGFRIFNDYLEANPNISYNDIRKSYEKILLWEKENTALDNMVKQAMYDVWESFNSVINFAEEKFITKIKLLSGFFESFGIYDIDKKVKGNETLILIINPESKEEIRLDINLWDISFEKLSNDLKVLEDIVLKNGWANLWVFVKEKNES